ncbi:MAG: metal-dependent hydrolase [Candidatus Gastranaerophilales bacterium]|nr:metal-dependent hydrolase [Candidatus Gastranaerophilales bacterium]
MTIKLTFLGHSAILIEAKRKKILIDPFISGNPSATVKASEMKVDDILLTHAHGDHTGDAITIARNSNAQISAIFELANYLAAKGVKTQGLNMGGKVPFDWGYACWLPASHSSSLPDGTYGGSPASILIDIDGTKIYHAGDTGLHYNLKMVGEFYKPDIALLPIGGFYTMGIEEALKAIEWLNPKIVVPIHYNTFPPIKTDVNKFKSNVGEQTTSKCVILNPNESLEI